MPQSKIFLQPKEALTNSAVKEVRGSLSKSVKKVKFVMKIFFSDVA